VVPPRRGEEFTVNVILPDRTLIVCHIRRKEIVWAS
jgi:hypothetical protein